MPRTIERVGIYWYPPIELYELMEQTWNGDLNDYEACQLIYSHQGDCRIWRPHMTLLDAVSILSDDMPAFREAVSKVLQEYLPIRLNNPHIQQTGWGNNTFISWDADHARNRLKEMRHVLLEAARDFIVVEAVSWENISQVDRLLELEGDKVDEDFRTGLKRLEKLLTKDPLHLIHAPNIPLAWYVRRLADGKDLSNESLPFAADPHISVATAVPDEDIAMRIRRKLPEVPPWRHVLEHPGYHCIEEAFLVHPAPTGTPPITVSLIDRITQEKRVEKRPRWQRGDKLPVAISRNTTLVALYGRKVTALQVLLSNLQQMIDAELGEAFSAYPTEQIHGTICGLEGKRLHDQIINSNFAAMQQTMRTIEFKKLFEILNDTECLPIKIRFGGYQEGHEYGFTSRGFPPYERSFIFTGRTALIIGWPIYHTLRRPLDQLRRSLRAAGVLHKYHWDRKTIDNDLFMVLGNIQRDQLDIKTLQSLEQEIQNFLAEQPPHIVDITRDDLKFVSYYDTRLPVSNSIIYTLDEAEEQIAEIEAAYAAVGGWR